MLPNNSETQEQRRKWPLWHHLIHIYDHHRTLISILMLLPWLIWMQLHFSPRLLFGGYLTRSSVQFPYITFHSNWSRMLFVYSELILLLLWVVAFHLVGTCIYSRYYYWGSFVLKIPPPDTVTSTNTVGGEFSDVSSLVLNSRGIFQISKEYETQRMRCWWVCCSSSTCEQTSSAVEVATVFIHSLDNVLTS